MDTPIELLTQALLGELPEERKRCFEAWLQESEEHRLLWEGFVSKDILKILCRSCMLWMQKGLFVSF